MNKGDRFVVELEYSNSFGYDPKAGEFTLVGADDKGGFWFEQVERAAAAYAAKGAPAPVSTAWEPKRDEVVLVEMEFVREKAGGEVYVQKGDGNFIAVPRSAIVGPAPVRARFAVGDVVVMVDTMEMFRVSTVSPEPYIEFYRLENGVQKNVPAHGKDIISLAEARERLAK